MRRLTIAFALLLWGAILPATSQTRTTPQTARQALLEMLMAKSPAQFSRHLPSETKEQILAAQGGSPLNELSGLAGELQRPGFSIATFDEGDNLIVATDPLAKRKIEVAVESDNAHGDEEDLQFAVHVTRDGQPETLPVDPAIRCTMKSEAGIWRLNEVAVTLRLPLGDPDFLKGLAARAETSAALARESAAASALRTLNTAEVMYSSTYPDVGYTCSLSALGGSDDTPSAQEAMLVDPNLASGLKDGYIFQASGCTGSPIDRYRIVAVPASPENGQRAFCTDENAVIRFAEDGQESTCLTNGQPLE